MKLISYKKVEDYGLEHCLTILQIKNRALIQTSFGWSDYSDLPFVQVTFGNRCLIDILVFIWRISFTLEICGPVWKRY